MHALVVAPRLVRPLRPAYTPAACARGTEGIAILELRLSPAGRADAVRVLRGLPDGLTEAARAAAESARWHPALLCGKPVAVFYTVTVPFDHHGAFRPLAVGLSSASRLTWEPWAGAPRRRARRGVTTSPRR